MPASRKAKKRKTSAGRDKGSSELGEGDFAIDYNERTGRPVRRSAGRKTLASEFVDSAIALDEPASSSEEADTDGEQVRLKSTRKRKRSPSPPMSPVSESGDDESAGVYSDFPGTRGNNPLCDAAPQAARAELPPIQLTFNVPPGHVGPFVVNLDIASLMASSAPKRPSPAYSRHTAAEIPKRLTELTTRQSGSEKSTRAGFLDLPAELRNEVYRLAFVTGKWFNFGSPQEFERSSAFLRTCRQVHDEGRSILYSENEFFFHRLNQSRGTYWVANWTEVGFKAVRKFVKMIGPTNLSLIRHVTLLFEDAVPSLNPHLKTAEERRFVHDEVLMSILNSLADYSCLRKLELCFQGRKPLNRTDHRFLEHLKRIRADEVLIVPHPLLRNTVYKTPSKNAENVKDAILEAMTRKERVFGEERRLGE